MIRFLETSEIIEIHTDQIERYGGLGGIRDLSLLQSAEAMPEAGFGGEYVHRDLFEMAAAYLFHLGKNHPLLDGNKRTALASALVFLDLNGITVSATVDELVTLTVRTVIGEWNKDAIAGFFREHGEAK